ncbi:MAG: ABC transporter substrate-binding protein [Candidatus Tectomicrobia bacterium]|nr:ABC transporter substrate-binding protein [Candidatus Tectomicrobia bacterium]
MEWQSSFTRREVLSLGLAAGLSSTLLTSPWPRRAWAQEAALKAGYLSISACVQYFAAKEQGFFKAEGLKIEDQPARVGAMIMEGIVSGSFELGFTNTVDIAQINLKGISVKIIYPGVIISATHPYSQMMVPLDSGIQSVKDFAGKSIGVAAARSSIDLSIFNWLEKNGVDPKAVKIVELGFAGIVPGLKSKQVDAVLAVEPAIAVIVGQKIGRSVGFPHGALGSQVLVVAYMALESWIEKNPQKAQAIVRALDKATQWLMEHPEALPGIMERNARIKEDLARKMIQPGLTRVARKVDLQSFIDVAAKFNHIPRSLDVCTLFSKYSPKEC